MKQLEIGDRCEVYRVETDEYAFGFKKGSFAYGSKEGSFSCKLLHPNGGMYLMFTEEGIITTKEVTHVATMVIKQLKNIG